MKKNLLIVVALLVSGFISNAQSWTELRSGFPTRFTGVSFISAPKHDVVWLTGFDGGGTNNNLIEFSRSVDGGQNFFSDSVGTDTAYQFSNISAINGDTAWVCMFNQVNGSGGGIWKTTDGGANWNQQGVGLIFDANSFPDIVHFWDGDTGVAIGDPNTTFYEIYTTVDGGATWLRTPTGNIPAPLAAEFALTGNYSVVGGIIWFATNKGRVYKSIDKGLTWTVATAVAGLPATQAMDVRFMDSQNGLVSIQTAATGLRPSSSVRRTHDGGATWAIQAFTGQFFTRDFGRIPGTGIYMSTGVVFTPTGNSGTSYSLDTGLTWITIDSLQHTAFGAYDILNVWSGGFTDLDLVTFDTIGGVFKFDAGLLLGVKNPDNLNANMSAYPNPSSGIVHMNFKVGRSVDVRASVYNLMGEQVYDEKFPNMTHFTHTFDFSYLPKGVYVLNLEYGGERSTQKLIIQ